MEDKVKSLKDKFSKSENVDEKRQVARYIRRVNDFLNYNTQEGVKGFSESLGIPEEEVKNIFGDGDILGFIHRGSRGFKKGKGSVDVNILTKDMCCSRLLDFDKKEIINEEFLLDVDLEKGRGKGSDIFINQVEQFKKLGFEKMKTIACRTDGSQNGYYTWARLGYDIDKKSMSYNEFLSIIKNSDNKEIGKCKSLLELMSFKEGREFWKKNGFTFAGVFDLKDGSNSMKVLKSYQQIKG